MQEISTIIDMSSTTTTTTISTKVENVDSLADDEVGLNISDSSINGSRDDKSSTDSNNSSSRSTPTPTGSNTSITPPINVSAINDKPKGEKEGEDEDNKDTQGQSAVSGGQLKFFKDGLLCLQLEHQNAGKTSKWVQIRTRTVFPSLVHVSKEVSIPCQLSPPPNSFNVSDDSSMLSSPILRESSWKQQIPRKGASNVLLQFFMTPAPCIIRRRKVLFHKFPRLTRQPYKSWMKKFSSCTTIIPTTTKPNQSSETTEPTQCLECDEHVVEGHQKINALNLSVVVSPEKGEEAIVVPLLGGSQHKSISKKKKQLHYFISRLSARVEKNSSPPQVNSDRESELNTNNSIGGGEIQQNNNNNFDSSNSKTPVKNIRPASSLSLTNSRKDMESCRDLTKNNSNSSNNNSPPFVIRPKITEKRSKILGEKDKTTILSVPLTAGKLIHRQMIKTDQDNNLPIDFSKMTESSSSSSSPSIYHHLQQQQQSDRRDIKSDGKLKKSLKREKLLDQRHKGTMFSHKSHHHHSSSSSMNNHSERKNLQSSGSSTSSCESAVLNLSSSSSNNQQCFSPNVKPFTLGSLSFAANQLYPINYLSVLAASSTPATSSAASPSSLNSATFPSYSNESVGLNFQQQLLQQHAMSSVISETVNSLLAANKVNNNDYSSSDRAKRNSKDYNKGHSLSVVQHSNNSGSLLKQMQHNNKLSKTKKTSSVNSKFKIPEFNAHHPSSSKSSPSKQLNYFGNNNAQQQSLLEIASSSPISRINNTLDNSKQNSFLRNLLDTSYPIPSNKTEVGVRGDIIKSNASKSLHNLTSSKNKTSNAEMTGNVRAKSSHHQSINAKQIKSNISNFNHVVGPYHLPPSSHSKSASSLSRSSSKYSSKSHSSDRDKGKERSASSSPSTTNFQTLSTQRPELSHHDPMNLLRNSPLNKTTTASSAAAAAAFQNSLLGHSGSILPPGFSPGAMAAAAAAAASYFKNPQSNDFNSLLSGMSSFDYASAFNSSQKIPASWSSFLPFPIGTGTAVGAGEGSAFRLLHPTSLATTLTSSASEPISSASALKYNDSSSDAPLNLCKKSRPN